jgi:two-component system sensor histidine kinase TctE
VSERRPGRATLRARLLWQVLPPLALTWLAGGAVATGAAYVFTERAFDQTLLDNAYALGANVVERDGRLAMNLSPASIEAVLFAQSEKVFFSVLRPDGTLVAGQGSLRDGPPDMAVPVEFAEVHYRGLDLRTATLVRTDPAPFAVVVGQTTRYRSELLRRLVVDALIPQAVLLLALGAWLRFAIGRELHPLMRLQQALDRRDAADLTAIDLPPAARDVERLAGAANALMSRVEASVRALREFTGNVAHELRTPLAGIRALAEYGLAHRDPDLWKRQLSAVLTSQERASHLVDQLLALALADEARDSIRLTPVAVDDIARRVVLDALPRAEDAGIDLGAEGLDHPVSAIGHQALVEGIVRNLLDNALRHGKPPDGRVHRVTVGVAPTADSVALTVTDNGPGIGEARRDALLQRWKQGPEASRTGTGSGLGLAIVNRYAQLLGGRLELDGAPEGGLRVTMHLRRSGASSI